jgi:hypothetical protein
MSLGQLCNFGRIDIDPEYLVSKGGHAGGVNCAEVTGANNCDTHGLDVSE